MKLSHKVPTTPWRAETTWSVRPVMLLPLVAGLSIFGFGEGLLVQSHWGATPWTVFAEGIAHRTGLPIGWSTVVISCVVLLAWWPLREVPGFGTIANLVIIAFVLDMTTVIVTVPHSPWVKIIYIIGAVAAIGCGSALYLTTGLGPGPRDGLMTSLHRRLHISVVYIRLGLELAVLGAGWLLGGTVGVGTAVFASMIGFSLGLSLNVTDRMVRMFAHD